VTPLRQETRARLYELLEQLQRPAGTDELAQRLGLHPNGVRMHLERLREAGLVVRSREPRPRGRPRDTWAIDPAGGPVDAPGAYVDLCRWLARAARSEEAEATGRSVGRSLAAEEGSAEERLRRTLVRLGFRPVADAGDGELTYRLTNCPYREAVREDPQAVCALHRGLTRGLLDAISPESELTAFVPHDPDEAGCVVGLRGPIAG
jgi:predicted ArsR family transcriptional regulator